jgi:hypothetical protein
MPKELFVAKIPSSADTDDLRALFNSIAPVVSFKRPRDFETGELRSFAFVVMATEEGSAEVIAKLNGHVIDGQPIVVKESDKPFEQRPSGGGYSAPRPPSATPAAPSVPPTPKTPELAWEDRASVLEGLLLEPGTATTAKIVVVGRPGKVYEKGNSVVVLLQYFPKQDGYPKGVPTPDETPSLYAVYIGGKQWKKIEPSLTANPEDILIAEGIVVFDPEIPGMAVLATGVNTRLLQMAANAAKREEG